MRRSLGSQWKPKINILADLLRVCSSALRICGGIFDFDAKAERLEAVNAELEDPKVWDDAKRAQELGTEKKTLDSVVKTISDLDSRLRDADELFVLAREEGDDETLIAIEADVAALEARCRRP